MQCFSCVSLSLSLPSRCISLSLFSDSYMSEIQSYTRQRATRAALRIVCQLVERDSNSIGRLGRQAGELVRFYSLLLRSVVRVPSHFLARQNMPVAFFYFFFHIKHLSHRAIYSSFLSTSGSCANHLRLSSLYPRALFLSRILQQIDTKLRDVSNCEYETRQRRSEKEEEILKESRERRTRQRYGNHEIVTHTAIVSPASALAPLSRAFSLSLLIFFVYPFPSLQMSSVLFFSSSNSVGAI